MNGGRSWKSKIPQDNGGIPVRPSEERAAVHNERSTTYSGCACGNRDIDRLKHNRYNSRKHKADTEDSFVYHIHHHLFQITHPKPAPHLQFFVCCESGGPFPTYSNAICDATGATLPLVKA